MCSVVGCDSWRRGAPRFKLPEDPERRLQWVQFILQVNEQKLKESSWTEITICKEHFTTDCFVNLTPTDPAQLKSCTVPSLCVRSQIHTAGPKQGSENNSSSCSTHSAEGPGPSDGPVPRKTVDIEMVRKKAALLQKRGKYVVNEKRLLQLFSPKCPLCGAKVITQKVTHGVLITVNQQCLQCDYRNQWNSQVDASVPTAEVEVDIDAQTQQAVSTIAEASAVVIDEELEESGDEANMDSDSDWFPGGELLLAKQQHEESEDETEEEEEDEGEGDEGGDCPPLASTRRELCTECGKFIRRKPHTCEHKIKPYSCNICGKRCVSKAAVSSHSRVHDGNYEHRCKYCHVTFKTKVDKITHEQSHITEGTPYKCPDCTETFATSKERRTHLEVHRGPPQTKCHICGVEFLRVHVLQRHLAVHTGAKPYKCSVCQRGFSQGSHLKSHMRMHTGERPFKCQHCDKCFNHNVSLKAHVQRYHSSTSGREKKRGKINKTVSDTGDADENGDKRGTDSGPNNVEEELDSQEEVQQEIKDVPKPKRSTGRPIGRPKRHAAGNLVQAGEIQGQLSNSETDNVKVRRLNRTHCSDEESEDELTKSDVPFDSAEEEEEEDGQKVTSSTSKSRGRAKKSDGGKKPVKSTVEEPERIN